MADSIFAGANAIDITPTTSLHLYGYPHTARRSTGIHDSLFASALYLRSGPAEVLFVACDIIFLPKSLVARARDRIALETSVPSADIMLTATHTHSGPGTVGYISNEADPTVPSPDSDYLARLENGVVEAACSAKRDARRAEVGLVVADGSCVGGNRRDPAGPSDPEAPVLVARSLDDGAVIAAMLVCAMHPTVLHEDSTSISGDFPAACRRYLQENVFGAQCVVLHHMGAAGNQSPRHLIQATTFEEADRLGRALARSIENAAVSISFSSAMSIARSSASITLPLRDFPSVADAERGIERARARYQELQEHHESRADLRTAECDVFGAEETLTLARAAEEGRHATAAEECMPAEVQCIFIGPWTFVGWPGEVFVEFALDLRARYPDTFVITLANGELQGYLVTEAAVRDHAYEASNALFRSPDSGALLLEGTQRLMEKREA